MYKELMCKCIELAKMSEGHTSPNPLVGAIIFDDDFNIISQGRHEKYGENHAERNAILSYNGDLTGKSIIVNLEPCSHYGKTPPCADLIIEKGIKKVIIGNVDPNPKVDGGGIKKLKEAGVEVITGILEKECYELNEIFMTNQIKKRAFVAIKTATTLDGKIATKTGSSKWITDEVSREEVQKLRNKYDAILTSSETVIKDNPSMTCRMENGRNPIRVVLDTNLKTPKDSKIYNDDGIKVIVIVSEQVDNSKIKEHAQNVEFIKCPIKNGHIDIKKALEMLYEQRIMSVLVEAGGTLNNAFIQEKAVDKLYQFIAPKILNDNSGKSCFDNNSIEKISNAVNLKIYETCTVGSDLLIKSTLI